MNLDELVPKFKTEFKPYEKSIEEDNDSPWLWNGNPIDKIPEEHKTFVYLITNKITKKRYIGFKTAVSRRTYVENHKKKQKEVESDWKTYWSSSENLQEDVKKYGKQNFIREIIWLTVNKAVGKYIELEEQITRKVMTENRDQYYNGIVNVRLNQHTIGRFNEAIKCDYCIGDTL